MWLLKQRVSPINLSIVLKDFPSVALSKGNSQHQSIAISTLKHMKANVIESFTVQLCGEAARLNVLEGRKTRIVMTRYGKVDVGDRFQAASDPVSTHGWTCN